MPRTCSPRCQAWCGWCGWVSEVGKNWFERVKFSINVSRETRRQRLAVCIRLPRCRRWMNASDCAEAVFERLKFDEEAFDGWDCYGADYCLSAKQMGLKVLVLPLPSNHCCSRASYPYGTSRACLSIRRDCTGSTGGTTSAYTHGWHHFVVESQAALAEGFFGPLYLRLLPNIFFLMKRELSGCRTVLDLGCGHHSPLQVCNVPFSVASNCSNPRCLRAGESVSTASTSGETSRAYLSNEIVRCGHCVEVLEHLTKEEVSCSFAGWRSGQKEGGGHHPNGYLSQDAYDDNPLQEHRSGWDVEALKSMDSRCGVVLAGKP